MKKTTITVEVPESIPEDKASLIYELGLSELTRDFHRKAEIIAYMEAKGWITS
ncbi:hypothetical protein HRbin01_01676 [archaeon HR01]|nr:hypothetical protein HRbin01_01676 [archaeon HR01]